MFCWFFTHKIKIRDTDYMIIIQLNIAERHYREVLSDFRHKKSRSFDDESERKISPCA